jgi:predicted nuclease with RNAse H fold
MRVVGLDLAGKSENPTGFCVLMESGTETKILHSDEEIMTEINNVKPDVIAIDAPLWIPRQTFGRMVPWRNCDQLLLKRGFRPLSPMMPTMQQLAERAMKLVKEMREKGYTAFEAFPRAAEKMLNLSKEPRRNQDEYDALLCALTGKAYLEGNYENLDGIIVPK